MEAIKINSGIKQFAINNENDELVAVVKIDGNDNTLVDRFIKLMENVKNLQDSHTEALKEYDGKSELAIEDIKKINEINKDAINQMISETEELFGKGLFKQIYKDNYSINADFVPTPDAIINVYDALLPLVQQTFETSIRENNKYSVKRGKKS